LSNRYFLCYFFDCSRYSLLITDTLCFSVLASMLVLTLFFTAIGEL
jgi:hypothetical protein